MSLLDELPLKKKQTYRVPTEQVDDEGMAAANRFLAAHKGCQLPDDWERKWMVAKGKFSGTFPKRVSSWLYREKGQKLSAAQASELGNLAMSHIAGKSVYTFDFVARIDWSAGDFGDAGSCYWGEYAGAKDMLEENHCRAVRFYDEAGHGFARAWLARLIENGRVNGGRSLLPLQEQGFVVLNGYGIKNGTVAIARILAGHLGLSYSRVSLCNSDGGMYINSDAGYLVGPTDLIDPVERVDLGYDEISRQEENHDWTCDRCDNGFYDDDDSFQVGDSQICRGCFERAASSCPNCGENFWDNDGQTVTDGHGNEQTWCQICTNEDASYCEHDSHYVESSLGGEDVPVTGWVCQKCLDNYYTECPNGVYNLDGEDCKCAECQLVPAGEGE